MRLNRPVLGDAELEAVRDVLSTGYLTQGPKASEFERAVVALTGSRHGFATSSCTTALHLTLVALGVGPGDEVVVPDLTFPATANVVLQQGARPVVADVESETFGMSADSLAAVITDRTKAIMPVHAFGLSADMDPIIEIANSHGIPIVEDAACALGGTYKGRQCGSMGRMGAFSFHPRKIITTGEGGMVVTDDDDLAERLFVLRTHGSVRGARYSSFEELGFNYRLSDINAAIGVVQMARLDDILAQRRLVAEKLSMRIAEVPCVRPPLEPATSRHTYQSYVVLLDSAVDRDGVIDKLKSDHIESTLGTYSLQSQPFFQRQPSAMRRAAIVSQELSRRALTLPLHQYLTDDDLDRLTDALRSAVLSS